MSFDLKKLVKGVVAEINPFDGGANFASTMAQQSPAKAPAPASTARPVVQQINQQTGFNNTPVSMPKPIYTPVAVPHINMPLEIAKQFVEGVATDAGHMAQGVARIPETVVRSVALPGAQAIEPTANTSQQGDNTGLREFFYGKAPIKTYQDQATDIGKQYQDFQANTSLPLPKVDQKFAPFLAPVLATLDLAAGGKGKAVEEGLAKVTTAEAAKALAEKNGIHIADDTAAKIAKTTDPAAIKTILSNESKPLVSAAGAQSNLDKQIEAENQYLEANRGKTLEDGTKVPSDFKAYRRTVTGDTVDVNRLKTDPAYFKQAYESTFARGHGTDEILYKKISRALVPEGREPSGYLADLYNKSKDATKPLTAKEVRQGVADAAGATPKAPSFDPTAGMVATKERGLSRNIQANENFSPELQAKVAKSPASTYAPFTDKAALASHEQFAQAPLDEQLQTAVAHLSSGAPMGKQEVVNFGKTMQALDAAGRTDEATTLHDLLAKSLTEGGQRSQAAKLLYDRTPEGLGNAALRTLRQAKVEITPELKALVDHHVSVIKSLPAGTERDMAIAVMQKDILKHIPQNMIDNVVSLWKAGLLSGVKTQQGNAISNATFGVLHDLSDPVSAAADKLMSLVSKHRTKTVTLKGTGSGAIQGTKTGVTTMRTGIDMRNMGDKYEQHAEINLGNNIMAKAIAGAANTVFRGMSAADQPFYYAALKNSMYDQAKAMGINKGLRGKALNEFMTKTVANPTEDMANEAIREAGKSVLAYDTLAFKIINGAHNKIALLPPGERELANAALSFVAPFVRVPTAFLSRTVDFTPLGIGREVFEAAMNKRAGKAFDQRKLSTAIGEGLTGTGAIVLGMALAAGGKLSGDYPKNDQKEQARWKTEHITANSIKLGDTWYSLNYMGPLGLLFRAGQQVQQAKDAGDNTGTQIAKAVGGLGQGLLGQSFLQGFSGLSDAISNPQQNLKNYLNSEVASLVPNIVNDIANLGDQYQRQTNTPLEAVEARIPGVRETLAKKIDVFGNELEQPGGSGLSTLSGIKPSVGETSPMLQELDRLKDSNGNSIFPTPVKTIGQGNDAVHLNPEQQTQRQQYFGQLVQPMLNQVISEPGYAKLSDEDKAASLKKVIDDANSAANRYMLAEVDPTKLKKPASSAVTALVNGHASASSYLNGSSGTDPLSRYQQAVDSYNTDKAAGKLTAAKDLERRQSLAKMQVQSKYNQDVLDFYGMSNANMQSLFKENPEQAKQLYAQAQQLDSDLLNAGLIKTSRFKAGTLTASSGRSSGTKTTKTAKTFNPAIFNTAKLASTSGFGSTSALRNLIRASKIKRKAVHK